MLLSPILTVFLALEVTLIYSKEDRYGADIEERILNSLEIIKEL